MKTLRSLSYIVCCALGSWLAVALSGCAAHQPAKQETAPRRQPAMQVEPGGPAPIQSVEEARQLLQDYPGQAADFRLPVAGEGSLTLNGKAVSLDVALAIINDLAFEKGWLPAGFEEKEGVRYYKYSQ